MKRAAQIHKYYPPLISFDTLAEPNDNLNINMRLKSKHNGRGWMSTRWLSSAPNQQTVAIRGFSFNATLWLADWRKPGYPFCKRPGYAIH